MAARKKKQVAKKQQPAARALGNDPFAQGAASREVKSAPPPTSPKTRTPTPELQERKAASRSTKAAAPAHSGKDVVVAALADAERPLVASNAPRPKKTEMEPVAHASVPELAVDPSAHHESPHVFVDPAPHHASPEVFVDPAAHHASPEVVVDPVAHEEAPTAELIEGPVPHSSSPTVFDATPFESSPTILEPTPLPFEPPAQLTPFTNQVPASGSEGFLGTLFAAIRAGVGLASRATQVDHWGKDATLAASLRPLGDLLYDKYFRVQVEGAQHLPQGPCVIVANHAGALPLDGPLLHLALRRERPELPESRWLLEDQIFHAPFAGVLANRLGAVRANPENAHRLLDEGRPIIVFPEGFHGLSKPFSERYQLRRFGRGGYVKIAVRRGVPIVPVAIVGGEESMPLLAKIPARFLGVEHLPITPPPLPARWFIRFAPAFDLSDAPPEAESNLAWVERTNLSVRDQIEAMITDLLKQRQSVF